MPLILRDRLQHKEMLTRVMADDINMSFTSWLRLFALLRNPYLRFMFGAATPGADGGTGGIAFWRVCAPHACAEFVTAPPAALRASERSAVVAQAFCAAQC